MYERNAALNGGYSGLANTWAAGRPPRDLKIQLPRERDSILTQDQAARVVSPKIKPQGSAMSKNVYWGSEGPLYTARKMKGTEQAVLMPAVTPSAIPAVKLVRDLPKADLGPLEGWSEIQTQQKLIVLSLLAVGVYLYCKTRWKTI